LFGFPAGQGYGDDEVVVLVGAFGAQGCAANVCQFFGEGEGLLQAPGYAGNPSPKPVA
jgi:hypothetical protein